MNQTPPQNQTPLPPPAPGDLVKAAIVNDIKDVESLLARGADINETFGTDGRTALINAVWNNSFEMVKFLVEKGADIDKTDSCHDTALMWAAFKGQEKTVRFLLDHDARLDMHDEDNDSARSMAMIGGHPDIANMLAMEPVLRQRRAQEREKAEAERQAAAAHARREKTIHDAAIETQQRLKAGRATVRWKGRPAP